jgi:hypothetical protein
MRERGVIPGHAESEPGIPQDNIEISGLCPRRIPE